MKFLVLGSALLGLMACSQSSSCGEGQVANKFNICIQPNYIQGCSQYQSSQACAQCEPGYKLHQSVCDALQYIERDQKINGCLQKGKDGKTCVNCANGFIRTNNTCEMGVKNCVKYEDKQCLQCRPNYALILGQCKLNVLLGCRKVSPNHTCQECIPPFLLKDNHCQMPNCQTINDFGCVTCQCGFYLTKDRLCLKSESGCLRYERAKCIDCLNHYRLKGGVCEIEGCKKYDQNACLECKQQYNLINGGCQFKNCEDWGSDQCFSCKAGFKKQNGVCAKQKEMQVCID